MPFNSIRAAILQEAMQSPESWQAFMSFLAGVFADAAEGYLFEGKLADDLGISQTGHDIMASIFNYKDRCGLADKPLAEKDKPF